MGTFGAGAAVPESPRGEASARTSDASWKTKKLLRVFTAAALYLYFSGFLYCCPTLGPITCIIIGLAREHSLNYLWLWLSLQQRQKPVSPQFFLRWWKIAQYVNKPHFTCVHCTKLDVLLLAAKLQLYCCFGLALCPMLLCCARPRLINYHCLTALAHLGGLSVAVICIASWV